MFHIWHPRQRLSYTNDAVSLFTRFSERHRLSYDVIDDVPVEVMWKFPVQKQLAFPVTLGLQNSNELTFGVPGFRSHFFPFPRAAQKFEDGIDAWVLGKARIVRRQRLFDFISASTLEVLSNGVWGRRYRHIGGPWPHAELAIQNTIASSK